jgi:hypothetical protein
MTYRKIPLPPLRQIFQGFPYQEWELKTIAACMAREAGLQDFKVSRSLTGRNPQQMAPIATEVRLRPLLEQVTAKLSRG